MLNTAPAIWTSFGILPRHGSFGRNKLTSKAPRASRHYSIATGSRLPSQVLSRSETSSPLINTFKILRPAGFNYHAGQAVNIYVPTQQGFAITPATFSMISAPSTGNGDYLEIAAKSTSYAPIRWLFDEAQTGQRILVDAQPLGRMHLPLLRAPTAPLILIGAGIGITPILSIVDDLSNRKASEEQPQSVAVLHQASNPAEFLHWERLMDFLRRRPDSKLKFFISDPPSTGQTTDLPPQIRPHSAFGIVNESVLDSLNPTPQHNFVVCGPPGFVDATKNTLMARFKVTEDRIFV